MKAEFFILGSKLSELDRVIAVLIFLNFCQNVKNWHKASANWTWTWIIKTKKAYFIKTNITRIKIYFLWINELIIPVGKIVFKTNTRKFFLFKISRETCHIQGSPKRMAMSRKPRASYSCNIQQTMVEESYPATNINFTLSLNKSIHFNFNS